MILGGTYPALRIPRLLGGNVALTIESNNAARPEKDTEARLHPRFSVYRPADWDFFTEPNGSKAGFIEDLSEGGCLLRTIVPIGHRRIVRILVKDPERNLWLTAVGRIIRREDKMEAVPGGDLGVTLYRFGVQFSRPINPTVLEGIRQNTPSCSECGSPAALIEELHTPGRRYCTLCHLRKACHNLLEPA